MNVIPAIDLMRGRPVRLARGEKSQATVYDHTPREMLTTFAKAGASRVHVVDLDGAFEGSSVQREQLIDLIAHAHELGITVQVGGGIRSTASAAALLDSGADAVVIGTLAVRAPEETAALCRENEGRIIIAADAKDGRVAIDGWQQATEIDAAELCERAQAWGAAGVLFTDVARDGMRTGPAIEATMAMQRRLHIPVLASGGVGSLADIEACAAAGIRGVIVGRALYEGVFTLEEALARC